MKVEYLEKFGIKAPNEGKLIVDLSSEWCGPCKFISPILENFRDKGLINLIQIDINQNQELAQEMKIHAVPTLLFFKDGKLLEKEIKVNGETVVNSGIMIGAAGELILEEIINQM